MIVVTGANGFIGANLALTLAERGDRVAHVDDYPSLRGRGASTQPPAELRYERHPGFVAFLDRDDLGAWLNTPPAGVRGVVHLGACSDTRVTDHDYVMALNFDYTRDLWTWASRHGVPMVYASSAATYGDGSRGYDDDADPSIYIPLNLYGESKQRFDLWALRQAPSDRPPRWAGLKYFNVYGPREAHKGRMVSGPYRSYHQVLEHGTITLLQSHRPDIAHGEQQRDFVYVDDAVAATLHFLDADAPSGLYNVGTGVARTWLDLARAVFAAMGRPQRIEFQPMPEDMRERYQYFTQATTARLRAAGFDRPFHTLEQGVAAYIRWLDRANTTRPSAALR
jgi:ADP-L-glycero-D-manno-heptose 6-epimerase